jgi:hypothetical protein
MLAEAGRAAAAADVAPRIHFVAGVIASAGRGHRRGHARAPRTHWQQPLTFVRDVDELIGLQLSTSQATPALLGDRRDAFVARLRQRLRETVPEGRFVENAMLDAWCARRP